LKDFYGNISPAVLTPQGIPDFPICGQSGPRFPVPGRIGKRPVSRFPIPGRSGIGNSPSVSRPNRESGGRELGISGSDPRVASTSPIRVLIRRVQSPSARCSSCHESFSESESSFDHRSRPWGLGFLILSGPRECRPEPLASTRRLAPATEWQLPSRRQRQNAPTGACSESRSCPPGGCRSTVARASKAGLSRVFRQLSFTELPADRTKAKGRALCTLAA
jgi:hypothetical protein